MERPSSEAPGVPNGQLVAVIDVGSNSVRLLVARKLSDDAFEVVDEERFDARIGENQQADGALTESGIARGVRAIEVMAAVAASHAPWQTAFVGTEALRRATNASRFLKAVAASHPIAVRVLSEREEAEAAFVGVANSTLLADGAVLDIGGGSLEVIDVAARELVRVQSAPLGAIYARERYFQSDPPAPREVRALRKAVRSSLELRPANGTLFGAGGAVRNIARLVRARRRYPLRRLHGLALSRRDVHRVAAELVAAGPEARRRMAGLGANRVDTLPAAAVVIDEVMDCLGAAALTVSGQGLREGIAWQMLRPGRPIIADVRGASIEALARMSQSGPGVADRATLLFDSTRPLHGLGGSERELLAHASRLSGIGGHIDFYNRDRHAEYLVHSADLHGFSHREIVLLAALVRWAPAGIPDLSEYATVVEPEDPRRAAILASLLGVAMATSRRGPGLVRSVDVRARETDVRLRLRGPGPLAPELLAIERQARRFETVFRTTLTAERSS